MPKKPQPAAALTFTGTATPSPNPVNRGDTVVISGSGAAPNAFVAYYVDLGAYQPSYTGGLRWAGSVQADADGNFVLRFPTSVAGSFTATFGPLIAQCTFEVV